MNAYLLLPVLWYELRPLAGGPDKTILFTLPGSLLWLLAVQLVARRVWIAHALMFPLYLLVAIDLYMISVYHMRLSSSTLLVIVENLSHSWEYATSNATGVFGGLSALLAGYAFCLWKIRKLRVTLPRPAVLAPLSALCALYLGVYRIVQDWTFLWGQDRNSPFGFFSQTYTAGKIYADSVRHAERARAFVFGAKRARIPSEPEVYVFVVGESSRPKNWGLYGYARNTNPKLSSARNLVVFRDVVTQSALTRVAVPLLLTRGSITNPAPTERERSIVSLYAELGFRTHWLSTQQRDPYTGAINRFPREAEIQRFYERRHDGVLLEVLATMLERGTSANSKLFFVLHMQGSHFIFKSRYPREFAVYPDSDERLSERQRMVNAYDNSIVYTDHLLSELVGLLVKHGGAAAFIYCSDHGENLRDDERELFGHFHNNEYDLPVPMLLWYSDRYRELFPEAVAAAHQNAERPLTTRSVFYTLADLAGGDISDPDLARLSAASRGLERIPRMVSGRSAPVDFDVWSNERGLAERAR
jgi:glucan phosphoethanolaminetransferase (alkaline phosphatase superfamily)